MATGPDSRPKCGGMRVSTVCTLLVAAVVLSNCAVILFPVALAVDATVGAVDMVTRSPATPPGATELAPWAAH